MDKLTSVFVTREGKQIIARNSDILKSLVPPIYRIVEILP